MKNKIKIGLAVTTLLVTTGFANASLLKNDLEWGLYNNFSVSQLSQFTQPSTTGTSDYTGSRLATLSEVNQLLDDLTYDSFDDLSSNTYQNITDHVDLSIMSFLASGFCPAGDLPDGSGVGGKCWGTLIFEDGIIEHPELLSNQSFLSNPNWLFEDVNEASYSYSFEFYHLGGDNYAAYTDQGIFKEVPDLGSIGNGYRDDFNNVLVVNAITQVTTVPETPSFAIFTLGLIGFLSRKFIKR